jgi:hypothetical protein
MYNSIFYVLTPKYHRKIDFFCVLHNKDKKYVLCKTFLAPNFVFFTHNIKISFFMKQLNEHVECRDLHANFFLSDVLNS